jgi:glycosyltransferase involved in cell wall biosynthesis
VHIASGDLWAGAEVMLLNLLRAQQRLSQIRPSLIALNEGELTKRAREAGVPVHVIPESSNNLIQLIRKCRRELKGVTPDIVHTHRVKEDVVGALATIGCKGTRIVRTVHGVDEAQLGRPTLARRLTRLVHRACVRSRIDRTIAVSGSLKLELTARYPHDVISYVANGIEVARMQKRRARLQERPICVGLAGRLVPVKRVDVFLRTASLLNEKVPGAFLFKIYGDGPEESALRALAAELNLLGTLFFEGFVLDIAAAIAQLDLLLLTSESEGLPMVILEAMALDVPVIASAVGEIPAVLANGKCGVLIDTCDPIDFAHAVLRYRERPEEFSERATAAGARVQERYSADACARAYQDQYRACLEIK